MNDTAIFVEQNCYFVIAFSGTSVDFNIFIACSDQIVK